jgi:aryl-alcohol dehydrogenase-like predicted oxidoreductase
VAFVELLQAVASARDATAAQVALAWLLSRAPWIVPIPGTTNLHRLDENLGAAQLLLSGPELDRIEQAAGTITAHGERYPAHLEALTGH